MPSSEMMMLSSVIGRLQRIHLGRRGFGIDNQEVYPPPVGHGKWGALLLIAEQPPAPSLATRHLQLALPCEHRHRAADPTQAAGDLTRRIDPGVLSDDSHLVDPHRGLDLVVHGKE